MSAPTEQGSGQADGARACRHARAPLQLPPFQLSRDAPFTAPSLFAASPPQDLPQAPMSPPAATTTFIELQPRVVAPRHHVPIAHIHAIDGPYDHGLHRVLRSSRALRALPYLAGLLLAGLMLAAVVPLSVGPFTNIGPLRVGGFVSDELPNNVFVFVMWVIWLPLLSIMTLAFGRVWCGNLCPVHPVSEWSRRLGVRLGLERGRPTSRIVRAGWTLPLSFILVTFVVHALDVPASPRLGALFFALVLAGAVVVGVVFRQGTWCRFVCPVGGWLGRIARMSPVALRPTPSACASCADRPCMTTTRCPVALNPPRLDSSQSCLSCWTCVRSCPPDRASMRLGLRAPGAELVGPTAPNIWESVFVASLIGLYAAVALHSPEAGAVPWAVLFFGLVALSTAAYVVACAASAAMSGMEIRVALATFGYAFLPFEFAAAVVAFGDEAMELLGVTAVDARPLLAIGAAASSALLVALVRRHAVHRGRAGMVGAAIPLGVLLVLALLPWMP